MKNAAELNEVDPLCYVKFVIVRVRFIGKEKLEIKFTNMFQKKICIHMWKVSKSDSSLEQSCILIINSWSHMLSKWTSCSQSFWTAFLVLSTTFFQSALTFSQALCSNVNILFAMKRWRYIMSSCVT